MTIDDVSNLSAIVQSLQSLSRKPTTRIVFDEGVAAQSYRNATVQIKTVSHVMGEILDSSAVSAISVQGYLDRTSQYLATLGDVVDIWEVGNEINGEWLGSTQDVVAKMSGAYDLARGQSRTTALTLYYNAGCFERAANEMFTWAQANVPARMKTGLDYVLVSYYEDDCNGLQPDWQSVFQRLGAMFPNSKLGFGEVGTQNTARKTEFINRYYGTQVNVPNFIGGWFWWYYKDDMVPASKPLWGVLNNAIAPR